MIPSLPFKVKTTVLWAGEEEGDLGFMENEIVEVYLIVDDAWWSGKLRRNGAEGIFPKEYVNLYEDPYSSSILVSKLTSPSIPTTPVKESFSKMYAKSPLQLDLHEIRSSQREYELQRFPEVKKLITPTQSPLVHSPQHELPYSANMTKSTSARLLGKYNSASTSDLPTRTALQQNHQHYNSQPVLSGLPGSQLNNNLHYSYHQAQIQSSMKGQDVQGHPNSHAHSNHDGTLSVHHGPPQGTSALPHSHTTSDFLDEEELTAKRRELERELKQLKLLEKQRKSFHGSRSVKDSPGASYTTESTSSRKRDDLSHKFSQKSGQEELNYAQFDDHGDSNLQGNVPHSSYRSREENQALPPPPPRHGNPLMAIDGQPQEFKLLIKLLQLDVLNLSELSATSAGSMMRHKQEYEYLGMKNSQSASQVDQEKDNVMDAVFEKKLPGKASIFKKFLKKSSPTSQQQQYLDKLNDNQADVQWSLLKGDMNRMNSLTTHNKQQRTKRAVREEGEIIVKPLEFVSEINSNETLGEVEIDEDAWESAKRAATYRKVENFISLYPVSCDLNEFIADVSTKFLLPIHQLRAILLQLCKLRIIEEDPGSRISQMKPKLNEIAAKAEALVYQINYLFKKMLDALRIPAELVTGFWKRPNEFYHNEQYVLNHCWLSVLLDDQFFILDIVLFREGTICNIQDSAKGYNEHYFLARPLAMVSTHIPLMIERQHVIPPVDQNIAFYLPRMYLGFYRYKLQFRNFNNALTRLVDLEHFECELQISPDLEVFTLVKTSKLTTNELLLCQTKWEGSTRICKIKAILPEGEDIGVLQIFAGKKGVQKHFDNVHELAVVVPIYHSGTQRPCKFVPRFPTVQAQRNDLYIKLPQNSKLVPNNGYQFEVEAHPAEGINSGTGIANRDFKLVIELPLGKYFRLLKPDNGLTYGVYSSHVKLNEVGTYRGLVIGDTGSLWYVFAQWESIAGPIT